MQKIKQLAKDTIFYGVGSAAQKVIGLFMFPIYTRLLSKGEFGIQDLMSSALAIISSVLILGMDSGASRYYYDSEDGQAKKLVLSTWLWTQLALTTLATALLIIFAPALCGLLFKDASLSIYFRLAVANLPFIQFLAVAYLALRLGFKSKTYSIVIVSGMLIQALFCILFVTAFRWGILGVFYGQLIGNVVKFVIAVAVTRHAYAFALSKNLFKRILAFGVPFVPASVSLWLLNYSNRLFLVRSNSMEDIGILSAAMRVGSIVAFAITAFRTAWGPFAFSIANDRDLSRNTYSKVLTYYSMLISLAMVLLSVFAREIILILATSSYRSASSLVIYTCLSPTLWGATYIVGMGFQLEKKTYHVTVMTLIGAVANIGLNFLLIPSMGVEGAAIATLVGNFVTLLYSYFIGRRHMKLVFNARSLLFVSILMGMVVVAGRIADAAFFDWSMILLSLKVGLLMLFCAFSFFLNRKEWIGLGSNLKREIFRRIIRVPR